MSARALNWAWDQVPSSRPAKLVLVALADRADEEGVCWPSRRWLARKCQPMTVKAVGRALTTLVDDGLILKEERLRRDDGTLGTWRIKLPVDTPSAQKRAVDPVPKNDHAELKNPMDTSDEVSEPASAQKRDLVWDVLVERFGSVAERTNAHAKRNKAVADLKRLGATAESVEAALKAWAKLFDGATATDVALATHYPQLLAAAGWKDGQPRVSAACPECGVGGGLHVADCTKAVVAA